MELESRTLTVQDVRADLQVGRNTVYRIFARPDFPAITEGRKFVVDSIAYAEWKKQRRTKED
ncbi:MAG: hypothetical protein J6A89_04365 [Clostridia bacterium]|nr:hypothetical protein [Clostridia bacterium]